MAPIACFEDYETGMTFETASIVVTLEAIEEFAVAYDPQVYHRAATAPATQFGRIIASGWQTASFGMRLTVDAGIFPPSGAVGVEVEHLRWLKPVHDGDALHAIVRVESLKGSPGRPYGFVRLRTVLRNQHGVDVLTQTTTAMVRRREPSPAASA
jgi:acyl dehydratase